MAKKLDVIAHHEADLASDKAALEVAVNYTKECEDRAKEAQDALTLARENEQVARDKIDMRKAFIASARSADSDSG